MTLLDSVRLAALRRDLHMRHLDRRVWIGSLPELIIGSCVQLPSSPDLHYIIRIPDATRV